MIMAGTMSPFKFDMYRSMLDLWKSYIEQICTMMKYTEHEYYFGMTEDLIEDRKSTVLGMLFDNEGMKIFFMNPLGINFISGYMNIDVKIQLLSVACHEVAHIKNPSHYESFSNEHTKIVTKVMDNMLNGSFVL
jgi:hypothetical protein